MMLRILLPSEVFASETDVVRIVAEGDEGFFGLLPGRLDCVASLVPGVLTYETERGGETYVAVDQGVLVKAGLNVFISTRNALGGTDLGKLREAVEQQFLRIDSEEKNLRSTLAKFESGLVRRLARFHEENSA